MYCPTVCIVTSKSWATAAKETCWAPVTELWVSRKLQASCRCSLSVAFFFLLTGWEKRLSSLLNERACSLGEHPEKKSLWKPYYRFNNCWIWGKCVSNFIEGSGKGNSQLKMTLMQMNLRESARLRCWSTEVCVRVCERGKDGALTVVLSWHLQCTVEGNMDT